MSCITLRKNKREGIRAAIHCPTSSGAAGAKLRAVIFTRCASGLCAHKVMDNGEIVPASKDKNIDEIADWLDKNGYVQRGAFIGDENDPDERLVVMWLQKTEEPEDLSDVVEKPCQGATVRYVFKERKFATTRSAHEIQRSRRRNWNDMRDLQYIRIPTLAQREKAWGVSLRGAPASPAGL